MPPLKAYNPAWAWGRLVRDQAARWQHRQLLTAPQHAAIEAAYPLDYYRPVWPLRVGLFVFTLLAISSGAAFSTLFTGIFSSYYDALLLPLGLLLAAACLAALEYAIRNKKNYHSGIDNALLYYALVVLVSLVFYEFDKALNPSYNAPSLGTTWLIGPLLLTLTLLLAAVVRYADPLVTVVAFFTYLVLVCNLTALVAGEALLPFALMLAAALAYAAQRAAARRPDAYYYQSCLGTARALALLVFYLGGNYLVVREFSAALHDLSVSQQIPFAPLFYAFTAGLPLAYIVLGLRRHDRLLLIIGLLALAFSIFTLRYYRTLLPPEIAAIVGGAVLLMGAGLALRYLRPARHGLTSDPDDEPQHFNLENLVVAQTATVPGAPARGLEFGGGQSGGGGATGQF